MPTILAKRYVKTDVEGLRPYLISGRSATRSYGAVIPSAVNFFQIIKYSSTDATTYDVNDSGLGSAIAAASSGDVIVVPSNTFSDNYTVPANVSVVGISMVDVIFSGQITLSDGSALETLSIMRSENSAGAIYGIVDGSGNIAATLKDVIVNVANATGAAYAVYVANGGKISAYDTTLLAETGSEGYAVYLSFGDFYHYGGRAVGTTALMPYNF